MLKVLGILQFECSLFGTIMLDKMMTKALSPYDPYYIARKPSSWDPDILLDIHAITPLRKLMHETIVAGKGSLARILSLHISAQSRIINTYGYREAYLHTELVFYGAAAAFCIHRICSFLVSTAHIGRGSEK